MRKPFIAGNWKMYHTPQEGIDFLKEFCPLVAATAGIQTDVVICPPATHLLAMRQELQAQNSRVCLGAQNMHWLPEGAYTGEISAAMLKSIGIAYVIIGHSERRQYFGETDEMVSNKGQAAVENNIVPIICVGEDQQQREAGQTLDWIKKQILGSLAFWDGQAELVVAYEPIWAIGTGLTATGSDAEEVIAFIRKTIATQWGSAAENVRILYGGSVKPASIKELMQQPNIDGALVGGASLQADSFAAIAGYQK